MSSNHLTSQIAPETISTTQVSWWQNSLGWGAWAVVLLVALGLRVHRLHDVTAWYDEAAAWKTIQFSWSEMWQSIQQNVHPPIYYVLLKLWAGMWGETPVSLRGFSVLCGVLTVSVIGQIVREIARSGIETRRATWISLFAATLYAINPIAIEQAQQARMYTLGILFAALLGWGTLRVLMFPRCGRGWCLVIFAGNLLPLTHYYGLFTSLAAACLIAVRMAAVWNDSSIEFRNAVWAKFAIAIAITLPIWLYWGPVLWAQHSRVQADYWIPPFSWTEPVTYSAEWMSSPWIRDWGWLFSVQLCAASLIGAVLLVRSQSPSRGALLAFAVGPPVLSTLYSLTSRNLLQGRYWSFAHLFFVLAVAIAVGQISAIWARRGVAAVLVGWSLFWVIQDRTHRDLIAFQSGLRGVGDVLRIVTLPHETVLVASPFFHPSVQWSLGLPNRIYVPDSGAPYTHFQGGAILRKREMLSVAETLRGNARRMWVVVDDSLSHTLEDPAKLQLPREWQLVKTFKFFEGNRLPGSLEIREYVRP